MGRMALLLLLLLFGRCSGEAITSSLDSFSQAPSSTTTATVVCDTSVGTLTIDVKGHWAPLGAQRFLAMVDGGWFENLYMPRVVRGYLTQFGPRLQTQSTKNHVHFHGMLDDPSLAKWFGKNQNISRGTMFFAGSGHNSRGTDMCIAFCELNHCVSLGTEPWETPFAVIREVDRLKEIDQRICTPICKGHPCAAGEGPPDEKKNCDMPPFGIGPGPGTIHKGEEFIKSNYPKMQKFHKCEVSWRNEEHEHHQDKQ
mmetsp:Transcript_25592/g.33315  ORF Transcript_25592/g.33315 Transcript_25592/m.33315 type:complete len:255 (-) Transcript_25592:196-960(-)